MGPTVCYRVHKPMLLHCLEPDQSVHFLTHTTSLRNILILSHLLHLDLPSDLYLSGFPIQNMQQNLMLRSTDIFTGNHQFQ
jgi:hypothetical protein